MIEWWCAECGVLIDDEDNLFMNGYGQLICPSCYNLFLIESEGA